MGSTRAKRNWCGWGWASQESADPGEDVWSWLAAEMGMPALLATPPQPPDRMRMPSSALSQADMRMLGAVVGDGNVHSDGEARLLHAAGRGGLDLIALRTGETPRLPDAVVYPRSAVDVMMLLQLCEALHIAVVPFGGGTSLRPAPMRMEFDAAIALDLAHLDQVIEIDAEAGTATAQAGIAGPALEDVLAEHGVTLGHRPFSFDFSTLGGWIAEDAVGARSGRYGRVRDWLIDAKTAAPCGWLAGTLAIGSRGAGGVVTEARLRVRPLPQTQIDESWQFPDFAAALQAARTVQRHDARPAGIDIADAEATRLAGGLLALARPSAGARFEDAPQGGAVLARIGFEGDAPVVARARAVFTGIARSCGGRRRHELAPEKTPPWSSLPYVRDRLLDRGLGVGLFRIEAGWRQIEPLHRALSEALALTIRRTVPRHGARGLVFGHILHAAPEGVVLGLAALYPRALGADLAQAAAVERIGTAAEKPGLPETILRSIDPSGILRRAL